MCLYSSTSNVESRKVTEKILRTINKNVSELQFFSENVNKWIYASLSLQCENILNNKVANGNIQQYMYTFMIQKYGVRVFELHINR